MSAAFSDSDLLDRLPEVRGKVVANAPLAEQTWFRVGGPAEVLYRPADEEDLAHFLAHCPADIPVTVIGAASNLLIRDGGVPGVVIRFGPAFALVKIEGEEVRAGAASIDLNVARAAQNAGIAGLEFLCGIPGTIGGGLRMNAGAYGREFKDVVVMADVIERNGTRRSLRHEQIGFSYRHTAVPTTPFSSPRCCRATMAIRLKFRRACWKSRNRATRRSRSAIKPAARPSPIRRMIRRNAKAGN